MGSRFRRLAAAVVLLLLLAGSAAAWWAWRWVDAPLRLAQAEVEFSVESGMPPRAVAQGWVDAGVQTSATALFLWFRVSDQATRIRAGSYAVGPGTTPRTLLDKMVRGDEVLEAVRLIEGWTFRQFRAALAQAPRLKPTSAAMSEAQIMQALGGDGQSPEGRFFPDTYAYSRGSSDLLVLRRANEAMKRHLVKAWAERAQSLPLKTADEALILASIVEKETGAAAERAQIAGVFANRLRLGMPLQTDPTVIYGLGEAFDGNLRKRDLLADGPFNTYTRRGLPPHPIAMPGLGALRAATRPLETDALYFVARGDGSSQFSATLADHNRAVDKYQRGR